MRQLCRQRDGGPGRANILAPSQVNTMTPRNHVSVFQQARQREVRRVVLGAADPPYVRMKVTAQASRHCPAGKLHHRWAHRKNRSWAKPSSRALRRIAVKTPMLR